MKTAKATSGRTFISPANSLVVFVVAGFSFAVLAIWVARHGSTVPGMDQRIHNWVMTHRTPGTITFAGATIGGGVTKFALPVLLIVGALTTEGGREWSRRLKSGLLISLVATVGAFLGLQINALEGRVRPPQADWAGIAGGPSFPSGHTTVASLFAASCAWAIATRVHAGWPRQALWIGAALYAIAVGWSRICLGVHWPTDVIGGWLYALTWLAGSAAVILTLRLRRMSYADTRLKG